MSSVTSRINEIKQPRGGYIKPSSFNVTTMEDNEILCETENIHASIIGMAVDYLTRFNMGTTIDNAFHISLLGARAAEQFDNKGSMKTALSLLDKITGIDSMSVINACKLTTFDAWYRNPDAAMLARSYNEINPDADTVKNIQTLVRRSIAFFDKYGPVTADGFSFMPVQENKMAYQRMMLYGDSSYGGYTATVNTGDGDFLTEDTLWDFKVSKNKPTSKHTLQLLMYWIMGLHSEQPIYKPIKNLGIYNPRLNTVYTLATNDIPQETIKTVEQDIICYR